jgi:hypothetical protein
MDCDRADTAVVPAGRVPVEALLCLRLCSYIDQLFPSSAESAAKRSRRTTALGRRPEGMPATGRISFDGRASRFLDQFHDRIRMRNHEDM